MSLPEEVGFRKIKYQGLNPRPRRYHSCVLYQDKMYLFGGYFGTKDVSSEFLSFNFQTSVWEAVSSNGEIKPPGRYGHSSFVFQDRLYIFGGSAENNQGLNDLYFFDFTSSAWSRIEIPDNAIEEKKWPLGRYMHSSVFDPQTHSLFVFGGSVNIKTQRNDFWIFSAETHEWKQIPQRGELWPRARAGHLSFLFEKDLFLFGGYCDEGGFTLLDDFYKISINPEPLNWEEIHVDKERNVLPFTARGAGMAGVFRGIVYTFGGYDAAKKVPSRILHAFNPQTLVWTEVPAWFEMPDDEIDIAAIAKGSAGEKPTPRYGHSSVMDSEGRFTIFAGSGSTYLSDILQFGLDDEE